MPKKHYCPRKILDLFLKSEKSEFETLAKIRLSPFPFAMCGVADMICSHPLNTPGVGLGEGLPSPGSSALFWVWPIHKF